MAAQKTDAFLLGEYLILDSPEGPPHRYEWPEARSRKTEIVHLLLRSADERVRQIAIRLHFDGSARNARPLIDHWRKT